jgi:hypothetical protein
MDYYSNFSNVTKSNPWQGSSPLPHFQRLSLRSIKGITGVFLLITSLGFLLLWQPAYNKLRSLQEEKTYWQHVLKADVTNSTTDTQAATIPIIPTMDQLPDIIEQCSGAFVREGVDVVSLNVERFGEQRETGDGARVDYGLVRLNLRGNWTGIVTSLKALEETQEGNIHLQEVVLAAEGGEALLKIYFCTGESI